MTFTLPTPNNLHDVDTNTGARWLQDINAPTNVQLKTAGGLPITQGGGSWRNEGGTSLRGIGWEFQASQAGYDVSTDTKVMLWHMQHNAPNRIQIHNLANNGYMLRIYSGTGTMPTNYKEYHLGGNDTPFGESIKGHVPFIIDLNDISQEVTGGTFSNTDVTSYSFQTQANDIVGTNNNWNYHSKLYILDTIKTSSSTPTFTATSSFQNAVDLIQGTDYTDKIGNWVRKIGSVIFIDMPFRIGDNSVETDFNDNGAIIISPISNDSNDPKNRLTVQAMRTYLNLRNNSADTAVFSGTWIWGTRATFDWNQNDSAIVTFTTPTFIGMGEFTIGSSIVGSGLWDNVDKVIMADTSVDVDGSVFKNQFGNHALQLGGIMDIANMRFETYAANTAVINIDGTTDVDDVNEELDLTAHGFDDGEQVLYAQGADATPITGLTNNTVYWANVIDANTISLHTSRVNAVNDTSRIGLTDTASSTTNSLTPYKHAILIDTAGTYTFSNVFFDQSGTNDIENTSGGLITIRITNSGTTPTVTNTSGTSNVLIINTIRVEGLTEGAACKCVANQTIGTLTVGDIIFEILANSSGIAEITNFEYESVFGAGLSVIIRTGQQGLPNAALQDDNAVFTDFTTAANSHVTDDMTMYPATPVVNEDSFQFGHAEQFTRLKLELGTVGVGGFGITWEYWNGSVWGSLAGVTDGTSNLTSTGEQVVSWTLPGDWATKTDGSLGPYYYVRARYTSGTMSTVPLGRQVQLDVKRYLTSQLNRTVISAGLTTTASHIEDTIAKFVSTD